MITNCVFSVRKIYICTVITWNEFELLMQDWKYSHMSIDVMHSDWFGNVQELRFDTFKVLIWNVSPCWRVDLMMLRNRDFRIRNFEYGQQSGRLATSQKSRFQAATCSKMSSAILQDFRFADVEKSRFQASKRWLMNSAMLQDGRFADAQKSRFQAMKRSNMGSAVQQWGRLATSQKSRFQAAKCSNMRSTIQQEDRFADAQESRFHAAKRSNMSNGVLLGCGLPTS